MKLIGGTVFFDDTSLMELSYKELSSKMAVVLTERIKTELMTCHDIVATGRYPYTGRLGILSREDEDKVDEAMRIVHAEELGSRDFNAISDGQRQRVLLARAICQEPEIIVLDEPTAMLDPSGRREVLDTVKKLNKEEGITILLITHYMDEAVQADRVVVMDDGVIRLDGTPRAVFAHVDELKALGLDVPQATELADRLGFADHAVLNTAECVDVLISNLEEQKLGCTDL